MTEDRVNMDGQLTPTATEADRQSQFEEIAAALEPLLLPDLLPAFSAQPQCHVGENSCLELAE